VAECIVLKGGSGADLDVVTAGVPDVLAGKVIVGADGEPLTGTMANNGAVSQALNAGGSYTIPTGYHNGSGKVTANSLSSQTSGTSTATQILSGYTAWVNGSKITGSIASLAGQTITPSASQQTVSSSGKYMTGNVVVNAVSNLSAGNIKKGVVVGGVTGSWEGYVAGATDLYYRGNNVSGWYASTNVSSSAFGAGQITIEMYNGSAVIVSGNVNLVGKNYLNIEVDVTKTYNNAFNDSTFVRVTSIAGVSMDERALVTSLGSKTFSYSVTAYQLNGIIKFDFYRVGASVFRIWLS